MMNSGTAFAETNVFPGKSWVHRHVVNLGAEVSCPSCFGNEYFFLYGLVEAGKSISHRISYGGRESGSGVQSVEQLIAFIN